MTTIIPDKIVKSSRRTISLHITPEGKVIVLAPYLVPKFFINKFIKEKEDWILQKLEEVQKRPKAQKRQFLPGEKFLYLGKWHPLMFSTGVEIKISEGKLLFPKVSLFRAKKELELWLQKMAREIITKRVEHHAKIMKVTYTGIMFSDTKSKWGTCFPDNSLQFNWRLIMAPLLVIDYVVIHELAHTTEKNHGRSFWNRVRLFTPAFRQHREWLNKNSHLLLL